MRSAGIETTPSERVRWADNYRTGAVGGSRLLADVVVDSGPARYGAGIFEDIDGTLGHSGGAPGHLTDFFISLLHLRRSTHRYRRGLQRRPGAAVIHRPGGRGAEIRMAPMTPRSGSEKRRLTLTLRQDALSSSS